VKRMHKALTQYYTETLSHRLPHLSPNLTAIVKDGNGNEAIKVAGILTIPGAGRGGWLTAGNSSLRLSSRRRC